MSDPYIIFSVTINQLRICINLGNQQMLIVVKKYYFDDSFKGDDGSNILLNSNRNAITELSFLNECSVLNSIFKYSFVLLIILYFNSFTTKSISFTFKYFSSAAFKNNPISLQSKISQQNRYYLEAIKT